MPIDSVCLITLIILSQRLAGPAALALGGVGLGLYNGSVVEPVSAKEAATNVDLNKVREAITEVIDNDAEKRGDGTSLAGTFIRLAWHASGTYNCATGEGGSNGARMRFDPEASAGKSVF